MKNSWILLILLISSVSSAKVVEHIAAIVNSEIITLSDMVKYRARLKKGGLVDEALMQLADTEKLKTSDSALIQHLINERLLDSAVKKQNMAVTIERVEQEMRDIARRNGISRDALKEALSHQGVVFSEYQNFIKTSLERQAVIEKEISSRIKISDEDVSSYYLKEKGFSSGQVFEFELAHILFLPQNGGEEAAKQRAKEVLKKLKNSTVSFDKIAAQYSEDPGFEQGGLLGTFKAGEMLKEIETAVRGIPAGEISGVVQTRAGYHILKVLRRTLVEDPALADEKNRIRNILYATAFKKQFRLWLDRKRDQAFIRINPL